MSYSFVKRLSCTRSFQKHKGLPKQKQKASEGATKIRRTRDDVCDASTPLVATKVLVRKARVTPPPSNTRHDAVREAEAHPKSQGTSKSHQTTTHSNRAAVSESQPVKKAMTVNGREQNQTDVPRVGKKVSMAVNSTIVRR